MTPDDYVQDDFVIGSRVFTTGIEQPTPAEVANSIWASHVQETIEETDFASLADINDGLKHPFKKRS
ncbi:MAG: hypothetical protein QM811_28700 [Pirellulales bacterium]